MNHEISMQEFLDDVRIMRRWETREDESQVALEMAYTFGFAQARMTLGGYVDHDDAGSVIGECQTLTNLLRSEPKLRTKR